MPRAPLQIDEEQALFFRAKRGHLAGPGAATPAAAARAILGAQSQQLGPSLLALSLRTKGRPSADALERQLFEAPRQLVRTWGQRETLFVFDPENDWADVIAAQPEWGPGRRGGKMPSDTTLQKALDALLEAGEPLRRSDVAPLVPKQYLREIEQYVREVALQQGKDAVIQFASGRLFLMLAHRGEVSVAQKVGTEQSYAARSVWFPKLAWTAKASSEAALRLAERYLASYGPATAADLAHFFGARVTDGKRWLEALEERKRLTAVSCGERKGLFARKADLRELKKKPPTAANAWPVRLLPLWDAMLMAHADKRWAVPDAAEEKHIWRPGAYVVPTVLARGRIVATWKHKLKSGRIEIQVEPLSGWRASKHAAGVRREARAVAKHLGVERAEVEIGA